jgi:hypothetical protein
MDLLQLVEGSSFDAQQINDRTAQIHAAVLGRSNYLDAANFTTIHPSDLELLFTAYDVHFFDEKLQARLGAQPLRFGLSQRMTSAGGKTTSFTDRRTGSRRFEISVSTALLFGCFNDDDHRPIVVSGIPCRNRLEALQRVLEHELVHLVEVLLWDKSSCAQARFHSIAQRFFGHTSWVHQLITPREQAFVKFGIRPGMLVRFYFEGVERVGLVNRVGKRATVLVEDDQGQPYANGKRYAKFYVPVQFLRAECQA